MGVSGLLPVLKPVSESISLEKYRGQTVAIDTYSWLHKAVFCCADKIVMDMPTKAYWGYFNKRLNMLAHFGITPYFVLDGDYLPRKNATESEREQRRDDYKQQALDAYDAGNSKLAFSNFQKACDVSPELAKSLIEEFKSRGIKYVVAPYEADSQMVFLEKLGLVNAIISEDSDLLIFGAQSLLTKLNDNGICIEIKRANLKNCQGSKISVLNDDQLLLMATISGCDYTKGIPRFGIQKAISQVYQYKTYERAILSMRAEGKPIPITFDEEYHKAKIAFRHQIVFNTLTNEVQHLNPLTEDVTSKHDMDFIISCTGSILDQAIHRGIANGDLNPHTKQKLLTREQKFGFLDQAPMPQRASTLPTTNTASSSSSSGGGSAHIPKPLDGLKRSNTIQSLAYRSSKPVPKQRRALINIMSFTNKISKKSTEESRSITKSANIHSPPNKNLSPTSKRQKTFVLSNVDVREPLVERSKFFQSKLESATFSVLNDNKQNTTNVVVKRDPIVHSDIEDTCEMSLSSFDLKGGNNSISQRLHSKGANNESLMDPHSSTCSDATAKDEAMINSSDLVMTDLDDDDYEIREFKSSTPTKKMRGRHLMILDELKDIGKTQTQTQNGNSTGSTSTSDADVGELNTAYYLDNAGDESLVEEESFEEPINKANILDEIYSFKKAPQQILQPSLSSSSSSVQKPFSPENFLSKMGKARHKPSPLSQRVPLGELSANVNRNSNMKPSLERFRFTRKGSQQGM